MTSKLDIVCPKCGTINPPTAASCQDCDLPFSSNPSTAPPRKRPPKERLSGAPPRFAFLIMPAITIVLLALLTWGGIKFFSMISNTLDHPSPYPTDPVLVTTKLISALAQKDYQACYILLTQERKVATVIKQQTRDAYFLHFERIQIYLKERAGENFAQAYQVSPNGFNATFNNDIKLSLTLVSFVGLDKKTHYAISEFKDFPIDVAPAMGFEQYNKTLQALIESGGEFPDFTQDLDPSDIIQSRRSETKYQRLDRLIIAFIRQRQLDTRHILLDWIIKEFPIDKTTRRFLTIVADNQDEYPQLRQTARNALPQ